MKRIIVISFAMLLIVGIFSSVAFASGVALTGIGARATVLGGAYRGIADDWSAMYWNPAGLTQIKHMQFGGSFETIMPESKYTPALLNDQPISVMNTTETENEPQTFYVPSVGFVYSLENMSFGLAVYAPFGLGAKWDLLNTNGYNRQYPQMDFEDNLQIIDIHPTFAYKVSDKLSVGLGVSIVSADILLRQPNMTPNPLFADPTVSNLLTQVGFGYGNHILSNVKLTGDGWGFGGNAGIKYDVSENLSIGVSGNYYADISLDGKVSVMPYLPDRNSTARATLEQTLNNLVGTGSMREGQKDTLLIRVDQVFVGGLNENEAKKNVKADATLPLPMTIGGGVCFTGIENLLLSADISWTQWSSWDVIKVKLADGTNTELVENWKDCVRIAVGAEYSLDALKLRTSFYTEPRAIPNETMSPTITDINRRNVVNVGVGYQFGKITTHASYERILIGNQEIPDYVLNADKTGYDNLAGTYKMTVNSIMVGLEYNF